jgi:hypothetical protein
LLFVLLLAGIFGILPCQRCTFKPTQWVYSFSGKDKV